VGYFGCSKVLYVIGNREINYFYFILFWEWLAVGAWVPDLCANLAAMST